MLRREFLPSGLAFGSAIHEALAEYHRGLQTQRPSPAGQIKGVFQAAWQSPCKGSELVEQYRDPNRLLAAIPYSEKLKGLPALPFIGELDFRSVVRTLDRNRDHFTLAERQLADHLAGYLSFKVSSAGKAIQPLQSLAPASPVLTHS